MNSQEIRRRVRLALYPQLGQGFSPLTGFLAGLILVSVMLGVVGTEPLVQAHFGRALDALEILIGMLFLLEFILRVWSAGVEPEFAGVSGTLRFIRRPLVVVDVVVIFTLLAPAFGAEFAVLRLLRLLRLLALAKFGRYSTALRTLARAVSRQRYELSLSVVLASLILLLSATAMYLLEGDDQPEAFGSIPRALWWSVATLTTVGYGDVYPITILGRVFAGLTAMAGIGLIALPAGIMASAFSDLSRKRQDRLDAGKEKHSEDQQPDQ